VSYRHPFGRYDPATDRPCAPPEALKLLDDLIPACSSFTCRGESPGCFADHPTTKAVTASPGAMTRVLYISLPRTPRPTSSPVNSCSNYPFWMRSCMLYSTLFISPDTVAGCLASCLRAVWSCGEPPQNRVSHTPVPSRARQLLKDNITALGTPRPRWTYVDVGTQVSVNCCACTLQIG